MATNKVLFGKGKLANVLKQFANPTAGMIAFGSADVTDEFKGGAIIADGQLVSSRLRFLFELVLIRNRLLLI